MGVVFIWALSSPPTPSSCPADASPRPFPADAGPRHFPSPTRPISAPARLLLPRTRAPAPPRPRVSDPAADARPLPGGWPPPAGRPRTARAGSFPCAGRPPQDLSLPVTKVCCMLVMMMIFAMLRVVAVSWTIPNLYILTIHWIIAKLF